MGKQEIQYTLYCTSRLEIWDSILDHWKSRLNPLDARLDPQKFWESSLEDRDASDCELTFAGL